MVHFLQRSSGVLPRSYENSSLWVFSARCIPLFRGLAMSIACGRYGGRTLRNGSVNEGEIANTVANRLKQFLH